LRLRGQAGEPKQQTFDVYYPEGARTLSADAKSTEHGGMRGGGGYYHSAVTIAPRWIVPGDGTLVTVLDDKHVTVKEVEPTQTPGGLTRVGWQEELMDMGNPGGLVREVTLEFDSGKTTSMQSSSGKFAFQIPKTATQLRSIEVHWKWQDFNDKVLKFDVQSNIYR
jgi:hypothetical protein